MNISEIAAQISPPIPEADSGASDIVGKDEFLKLLVTQMQHQDPLNPQDPTEYTAQLAQFSNLEQLISINDGMTNLADLQTANARVAASGFIGHEAWVAGDNLRVEGGEASTVRFDLPSDSASTSLSIYNSSGALVDVVDLGAYAAGSNEVQWAAVDSNDVPFADGSYRFEVSAQNEAGDAVSVVPSFTAPVTRVLFNGDQTLLEVGGQLWSLDDILAIGDKA